MMNEYLILGAIIYLWPYGSQSLLPQQIAEPLPSERDVLVVEWERSPILLPYRQIPHQSLLYL